jgi:hypothetical protein
MRGLPHWLNLEEPVDNLLILVWEADEKSPQGNW